MSFILNDLSQNLVQALEEYIEAGMCERDDFDIRSRSDMDKIFGEYKFQQENSCDNPECLVEAGNLLGVEKSFWLKQKKAPWKKGFQRAGGRYTSKKKLIYI